MKNIKPLLSESGQLSIFFASTLLLLVTCMAFVINVGLFVKTKINLQNAVDAAAYSGASVQARQLSDIAYMNWELRNAYKEWMFKYYVIGELSQNKTRNDNIQALSSDTMDFRLAKFDQNEPYGDYFNVPSSCLHFAQAQFNICSLYTIPGLPRFPNLGIVGVDETQNEFMNVFVKEKAKDCSKRSDMNFKMVLSWSYGTQQFNSPLDVPQVAAERLGVWPKAFELALRIRNLEKLVNTPPVQNVCKGQSGNCNPIENLHQVQGQFLPVHERTVKAFYSAYRNLGNNDPAEGLKSSFRLTEISPTVLNVSPESSLSGVLIPEASASKYYLDLRLNLVNFVIFFSLFSTGSGQLAGTGSEAQCSGIKAGLPVPGLPFSFDKNPEFITYYAVKGEVDYWGLFNPFSSSAHLVAYAAAKPFGGRIGPMLLKISKNQPLIIRARQNNGKIARSFPYISGMNPFVGFKPVSSGTNFKIGYPIPLNGDFWVQDPSEAIGGNPKQEYIHFAIPNLLYELNSTVNSDNQSGTVAPILVIQSSNDTANPVEPPAGLFDRGQYLLFKNNLRIANNVVDGNLIQEAIARVQSPTLYEAMNYLIPSQEDKSSSSISSFPTVPIPFQNSGQSTPYRIMAPLWGSDTWFKTSDMAKKVFEDYIQINKKSIDTYISSLQNVAKDIMTQSGKLSSNNSDQQNYTQAAQQIHDNPSGGLYQLTCNSMAGKFAAFFLGPDLSGITCPANLETSLFNYWERKQNETNGEFSQFFIGEYYPPLDRENTASESPLPTTSIMTGYMPGALYGAESNGNLPHPLTKFNSSYPIVPGNRNYYSSKLISIQSILPGTTQSFIGAQGGSMTTYSEGAAVPPVDIEIDQFLNPIDSSSDNVLLKVTE